MHNYIFRRLILLKYLGIQTILLISTSSNIIAQPYDWPKSNPIELGKVRWLRSYEAAIETSINQKKPILILFQEVPGCHNCTTFGQQILSHPLVVEIIETYFIPLAIYNNHSGVDATIMKKYNEPAYNNPVTRVIDQEGDDIVPRFTQFKHTYAFLEHLKSAIECSNQIWPAYGENAYFYFKSIETQQVETIYLSMYCFWSGEKNIGNYPGVLHTEAGHMHGKEVVKVSFNPAETTINQLYEKASSQNCGDDIYADAYNMPNIKYKIPGSFGKAKDDKYYLRHSKYAHIPMTDYQKTLVNSAIAHNKPVTGFFSPRQIAFYKKRNQPKKLAIDQKIEEIWWK